MVSLRFLLLIAINWQPFENNLCPPGTVRTVRRLENICKQMLVLCIHTRESASQDGLQSPSLLAVLLADIFLAQRFYKSKIYNTTFTVEWVSLRFQKKYFSPYPGWPKVPLSLQAPKRECGIFGPGMIKNRILNMGIKRATPEHMFATLAFGSGGNLHVLWTGQLFTSLVV